MSGPADDIDPRAAAALLADWGFLATPDLPDRPGPASLLVAIRPRPTLRHYDPELVQFWVPQDGHGCRRQVDGSSPVPLELEYTWGPIQLEDRLHVVNDYLSFGGRLRADRIDGTTYLVFLSEAPILRRGGHSQPWDPAAEGLGAFFARLRVPVQADRAFEAAVTAAGPLARYAAFVADSVARARRSVAVRSADSRQWILLRAEERRLQRDAPRAWLAGEDLLAEAAGHDGAIGPRDPRGGDLRQVAPGRLVSTIKGGGAS